MLNVAVNTLSLPISTLAQSDWLMKASMSHGYNYTKSHFISLLETVLAQQGKPVGEGAQCAPQPEYG